MDKHESCQINEKQGGVRLSGATRSTLALPSFPPPCQSLIDSLLSPSSLLRLARGKRAWGSKQFGNAQRASVAR